MVNEVIAVGMGLVPGSMVAYIIEFFVGVAVLYLALLGALKTWDILTGAYQALRADMVTAKQRNLSLFGLWKGRAFADRSAV